MFTACENKRWKMKNKNEKRKIYRKFIRPDYKPSMVSYQTDAIWRQRALQRNTQSTPSDDNRIGNYYYYHKSF